MARRALIAFVGLVWLPGHASWGHGAERAPGPKPGPPPATAVAPSRLFYYQWSGTSPGADFTATSLFACEMDLVKREVRVFARSAQHPQKMLPYGRAEIIKLLAGEAWKPLAEPRADVLRAAARAWLATDPPKSYEKHGALGTEDGFCEILTVVCGQGERAAEINPHGHDFAKGPPPEWYVLLSALQLFSGIAQAQGRLYPPSPVRAIPVVPKKP